MISLNIKGPGRVDVRGHLRQIKRRAVDRVTSAVENSPEVQAVIDRRLKEGIPEDKIGEDPQVVAVVQRVADRALSR